MTSFSLMEQRASTPSRGGGEASRVYRRCFESSQEFGCGGRVDFFIRYETRGRGVNGG